MNRFKTILDLYRFGSFYGLALKPSQGPFLIIIAVTDEYLFLSINNRAYPSTTSITDELTRLWVVWPYGRSSVYPKLSWAHRAAPIRVCNVTMLDG